MGSTKLLKNVIYNSTKKNGRKFSVLTIELECKHMGKKMPIYLKENQESVLSLLLILTYSFKYAPNRSTGLDPNPNANPTKYVSMYVYMQRGGHARVTYGARLELVGPAPATAAETEMAARQQQHAALQFPAHPAQPLLTVLIRRLSAIYIPPVITAAARLHFLLRRRGCCGASVAELSQGVLEIGAEGIRSRLVRLRHLSP